MTNRLATHLTAWKWWYALLAVPALLIGSNLVLLAGSSDDGGGSTLASILMPLQFVAFAVISLLLIALVSRRWPTTRDLGLRKTLGLREIALLVVVFVVSHLLYWLLNRDSGNASESAVQYFEEMQLGAGLPTAFAALFTSVILAPVCEEILYRGAVLRPIHDALARTGKPWLGAVLGIVVSSVLFALPHVGGALISPQSAAYLITGVAFGLVYIITGSMTAAMVSHSLQSCFAFAQILIYGAGEHEVSPILYVLVLGCPLWVYLCARGLRAILPKGRPQPVAA